MKYSTEELISNKGDLESLKNKPRNEVYLILEDIRSMYNVGAIFRTADGARIKKLYLCGITAYPPRKEIEKTALKTIEHVPWEYHKSAIQVINKLKKKNIQILALEQCKESKLYNKVNYSKPVAIVVGNEISGVSEEALDICDKKIEIPMHGIANSLNVATATGIILYKAIE